MRVLAAALVAALAGGDAAAEQSERLGRLFTTPLERSALDQLRIEAQFARPRAAPEPPTSTTTAARRDQGPEVSRLEVNGIIKSGGRPAAVWVNGTLVERGQLSRDGLTVVPGARPTDGVQLRLPSGASSVRLKPGQAVDVVTGTLVEAWEARPDPMAESILEQSEAASPDAGAPEPAAEGAPEAGSASPSAPSPAAAPPAAPAAAPSAAPSGAAAAPVAPVSPAQLRALSALPPAERAAALGALRRGERPATAQ